ncbi:hypothetical protein LguiA_016198 [Lonicera macranthoides]
MDEESADLVSDLPQEILQHIVSLIPLEEAVRTSTLSTQWRSIWTPFLVNLEFDSNETSTKQLNKIMATFLNSHNAPQLLKFSLTIPNKLEKNDQFFLVATKGAHKDLLLNFSEQNKDTTTHFNLVLEPTETINSTTFSSLKTLHLRSVTNIASNFVSALFSNCSVLESLKLENCMGMQDINVKANRFFEKFIVVDCKELVRLTICAPHLKTFWYRGVLPIIQLKNSTHLVDVTLNLKDGNGEKEFDCEDVLSLLASLKDIEVLTISGWLLEVYIYIYIYILVSLTNFNSLCCVIFEKLEFKFNKLKELRWIDSLLNKHKRDSLACFLNSTTFLEYLFVNIDEKYCSPIPCPLFHQYWHEPHLWMDYQMVKSNASQLNHLKIVNFAGFKNEEDELLLMDLLLHKAIVLKAMIVSLSTDNSSWVVTKIPQSQLSKTTLKCHSKRTVVSSSTIDCSFVLTEQVNNDSCL